MNTKTFAHVALAAAVIGFVDLCSALSPLTATTAAPASADETFLTNLAWQITLDRAGFSPGLIDGRVGAKTELATREFQKSHGLGVTGQLDEPTWDALGIASLGLGPDKAAAGPGRALIQYTVTADDLAAVGPLPKGWVAKSQASRLPYPSLDEALAERFHCTRGLLAQLNPGMNIAALKAGSVIQAPNVQAADIQAGNRIEVSFAQKVVRVYSGGRVVGMFNCSIAADRANLPRGNATVQVIANNPVYRFDPKKWTEVRGVKSTLLLPPGPRNPVGSCWVGLSLKGYGLHGTPAPEMIGKTGSHGCIRLANWDAVRLGRMVKVGTPVTFVGR